MKIITTPGLSNDGRYCWAAFDDDTYDCDCDQDGFFSTSLVGYGQTEADAIADLEEQLSDALAAVNDAWS